MHTTLLARCSKLLLPLFASLLLLAACVPDPVPTVQFDFSATAERIASDVDTKVLLKNEELIYWELGDIISIQSNAGGASAPDKAYLSNLGIDDFKDYQGVFISHLPESSTKFTGLFPYHEKNKITYSGGINPASVEIFLSDTQKYRHDTSFSQNVLPMVAVFNAERDAEHPDPFNLDFHNLGSIIRLQFYNETAVNPTIKSIEITSADHQLCGPFKVVDPQKDNPYLEGLENTAANRKLILDGPSNGSSPISFDDNKLASFYLVVPAVGDNTHKETYVLSVKLVTDQGDFSASFSATTRRCSITYLNAIGIKKFDSSDKDRGEQGLAGNGTKVRPFKIYTYRDLVWLRDRFKVAAGGDVYINDILVTKDSYFRIMRSDIVLPVSGETPWLEGIPNFTGHLDYEAQESAATIPGITNNTVHPLFESISAGGDVQNLTVRTWGDLSPSGMAYSPFCNSNAGTITSCRVTTLDRDGTLQTLTMTGSGLTFAGLCVSNSGTISGSGTTGSIVLNTAGQSYAGVCSANYGTITGCTQTSPLTVSSGTNVATAAGVVKTNYSYVSECIFAAQIPSAGNVSWGGIVYDNHGSGATIKTCRTASASSIYSESGNIAVGGIACLNSGNLDGCYIGTFTSLRGRTIGGLVATMTGGKLTNCYINSIDSVQFTVNVAGGVGGGLVGSMSGGSIENSYAALKNIVPATGVSSSDIKRAGLVGVITAGSLSNVYSYCSNNASLGLYTSESAGLVLTSCHTVASTVINADITNHSLSSPAIVNDLYPLSTTLNDNKGGNSAWMQASSSPYLPILEY